VERNYFPVAMGKCDKKNYTTIFIDNNNNNNGLLWFMNVYYHFLPLLRVGLLGG
jgi:hypothetical protein